MASTIRNLENGSHAQVQQVAACTWQTKIPVHLSLAPDNISSPTGVRPIYLMAPRQGYLHVVAAQAWPHLQHVLPSVPGRPGAPRPWFDSLGVPLKWYLPCGVLYDLLADEGQLPWRLTIHYTHPPEALLGWDTGATPQAQFMNSLKEACYICRGTDGASAVMRMGSSAQEDLWSAVQAGDVASYRSSLEVLKMAPTPRQGQPPNIPVRLLLRRATAPAAASAAAPVDKGTVPTGPASRDSSSGGAAAQPVAASSTQVALGLTTAAAPGARSAAAAGLPGGLGGAVWESCISSTSRPVPALQGVGGQPTTLAHLLHMLLPHVFPSPPPPSSPLVLSGTAGGPAASAPAPASTVASTQQHQPHQQQQPLANAAEGAAVAGGCGGTGGGTEDSVRGPATDAAPAGMSAGPGRACGSDDKGGGGGMRGSSGIEGTGAGSSETGGQGDPAADPQQAAPAAAVSEPVCRVAPEGMDFGLVSDRAGAAGVGVTGTQPGASARDGRVSEHVHNTCEAGVAGRSPSTSAGDGMRGETGIGGTAGSVPDPSHLDAAASGRGAAGPVDPAIAVQTAAAATAGPSGGPVVAGVAGASASAGAAAGEARSGAPAWPPCRVLVGGICPPLAAPIGWLHAAMHSPDLFLYIVVRMDMQGPEYGVKGVSATHGRACG